LPDRSSIGFLNLTMPAEAGKALSVRERVVLHGDDTGSTLRAAARRESRAGAVVPPHCVRVIALPATCHGCIAFPEAARTLSRAAPFDEQTPQEYVRSILLQ
jgi:hypothetical protein